MPTRSGGITGLAQLPVTHASIRRYVESQPDNTVRIYRVTANKYPLSLDDDTISIWAEGQGCSLAEAAAAIKQHNKHLTPHTWLWMVRKAPAIKWALWIDVNSVSDYTYRNFVLAAEEANYFESLGIECRSAPFLYKANAQVPGLRDANIGHACLQYIGCNAVREFLSKQQNKL